MLIVVHVPINVDPTVPVGVIVELAHVKLAG